MDFTKFSDENFDLKDWINNAFQSQIDPNQNTEQFVATLVTKLQVFIQEINNSIDETSHQTIQNFPRILREIDVLKQEAFMLKEQMKNVRDDLLKVEKNTVNESMKLLLDLDIIRTNLLNVQIALQEADNWTTLTSDLDSILQTKDINKISNHIESMQNSLILLQDESMEYANRCALLEDFKNKFETLMSADIIGCFNSKSIDLSKNYVQIFGQMNRLDDLKKYYYQCEKAKALEKLNDLMTDVKDLFDSNKVVFDVGDDNLSEYINKCDRLNSLLSNWLDYLIQTWHNEIQWCRQIFNDSHSIVINLLNKSFEEYNKNYEKYIQDLSQNHKNASIFLQYLGRYKQETDRFVQTLNSSAENMGITTQSQLNDQMFKLFQQAYQPFKLTFKQYSLLVSKNLQSEFETNIKLNSPDTLECVQLLNNSVSKVFNLVDYEIDRCISLTNGCGFSMLVDSFRVFLKNYVDEFKRVVTNIKERKKDTTVSKQDQEDWDSFRHFVRIIQIVGDLIIKYESLEESLDKNILNTFVHKTRSNSVVTPSTNQQFQFDNHSHQNNLLALNNYKEYFLDEKERLKLNGFIGIIETGDDYSLMKDLLKPLFGLSENVHKHAFEIVFSPVRHLLKNLAKSNIWQRNENLGKQSQETVPLFALAPQEYITKIGQYLLTLPQNFEPFTMQDNNENLIIALRKGKLPYLDEKDLSDDITACWLDSIANATYVTLSDEILKMQEITVNSQRQLIIDIEFIMSVLDDVGLKDYSNLSSIVELLKVGKEEFEDKARDKPVRILSAIRKMRSF
ncbi:unnamed protein product [Brachionus calyciflorus]|uniref:Conserved oligomeric Golgi complex subunit 7 n=1 Tax=Brachionus calyciflorus TaxID=104777 RepID=A0A813MF50_9BILA|nr:unnamed protein product [Brachionus calyciflorus]